MNFLMIDQSANHLSITCAQHHLKHIKNTVKNTVKDISIPSKSYPYDFVNQSFTLNDFEINSFEKKCQGGDEILTALDQLLKNKGIPDAIIISHGPGFFNSLRLIAACAQSLAFAFNIPLLSFDSLLMHAKYRALDIQPIQAHEGVICLQSSYNHLNNFNNLSQYLYEVYIDARMNQHYHAICYFDQQQQVHAHYIKEPCLISSSEVPMDPYIFQNDASNPSQEKPSASIALLFLALPYIQKAARKWIDSFSQNHSSKNINDINDIKSLLKILLEKSLLNDILFNELNYVRNKVAADLVEQKKLAKGMV